MNANIDTTLQFSGLKSGKYEFSYVLDGNFFERFENEELRDGKVDFAINLEKNERLLLINFTFQGTVKSTCDRCLGEIEIPVEGEQTLYVKFSDTETSEDENVIFLPEDAYQIDLAQWMYEYVAVSLPMQKIHPEGQCDPEMLKYITNEAIDEAEETGNDDVVNILPDGETDPRWNALKQLLEK
ncbi:MAG: DUF177 domain-containing protein [Bacteroidales bacterium]|nr:DUF177 domain-containing protein [Candidatus Colimorpha merdihippi]